MNYKSFKILDNFDRAHLHSKKFNNINKINNNFKNGNYLQKEIKIKNDKLANTENKFRQTFKNSNSNLKKINKSNKSLSEVSQASSYKSYHSNYFNCKGVDLTPDNSNIKCLICDWEYPLEMNLDEKNAHINFCLEGEGSKHKNNFLSSMRLIKMTIEGLSNDPEENTNIDKEQNSSNMKEKNSLKQICSFCSKTISLKNGKTFDSHLFECYSQQEKEILASNKKKKKI